MRILVISNVVPYPPHSGMKLRILHLLKRVTPRHEVTLCSHAWSHADEDQARLLGQYGIRAFTGMMDSRIDLEKLSAAARFGLSARPPELALYRSKHLSATLRDLFRAETFDVLQIEEPILAHYADLLPRGSATKRLLTFHDIHFVQSARASALEQSIGMRAWRRFNSACMRYYEPRVAGQFHRCVTVSEHDRQLLLGASPGLRVDVVPNGVDTTALRPLPELDAAPAIVFVGSMFYKPCEDGARWLIREILPVVRRHIPNIETWIVGQAPGPGVLELAGHGVSVTGEVEDIQPYYERAAVAVAPLRGGSGSRLKILEAMALGRAVVSTTLGAEGLEVEAGKHLLIADGAAEFGDAIVQLIQNQALRVRLTIAARDLVEKRYDWDSIATQQLRTYEEMMRN